MFTTKKLTITAMMLAIGILLPQCFHLIPNAGSIFAPMHLPIIICGFICGPFYGAIIGLLCPLLSFLFTGMPMIAVLPGMMIELFFYGLAAGIFFRIIHTRNLILDVYLSLIIAMLIGRIFGGLTNYLLFIFGRLNVTYSIEKFFTAYFVISWPAWLIQLVLIPAIIISLAKINFIKCDDRYLNINKQNDNLDEQIEFFNDLAPKWADSRKFENSKLEALFAPISLKFGANILDVGCGCGVLEPYLINKDVYVNAIDISPKMIEEAKKQNSSDNVNFEVANYYNYYKGKEFDNILVFDAYPHFKDKRLFVKETSKLLKKGGSIWIFFDCSKEEINEVHKGKPSHISTKLKSPLVEAKYFKKNFDIGYYKDDNNCYYLQLIKR